MKVGDLFFAFAGCGLGGMMEECLEGNGKNKFLLCLTRGAVSDGDQVVVVVVGCRVRGKEEDWLAWILSMALCPQAAPRLAASMRQRAAARCALEMLCVECGLGQGDVGSVSISTATSLSTVGCCQQRNHKQPQRTRPDLCIKYQERLKFCLSLSRW